MFPFQFSDDLIEPPSPKEAPSRPCYYVFSRQLLYSQAVQAHSLLDLPEEVLIDIFNRAAATDAKCGRNLALSCKYIANVTRGARLEYVLVRSQWDLTKLKEFVCAEADERQVARAIRKLWLSTSVPPEMELILVSDILRACVNAQCIAVKAGTLAHAASSLGAEFPHTEGIRLFICDPLGSTSFWGTLSGADHTRTVLHNLTHLQFSTPYPMLDTDLAATARHLPRLTHLCVPADRCPDDYQTEIRSIAERLAPLRMQLVSIVVVIREELWMVPPLDELIEFARKCGPKVGILFIERGWSGKAIKLWKKLALEGEDAWTLAKAQMESRSRV